MIWLQDLSLHWRFWPNKNEMMINPAIPKKSLWFIFLFIVQAQNSNSISVSGILYLKRNFVVFITRLYKIWMRAKNGKRRDKFVIIFRLHLYVVLQMYRSSPNLLSRWKKTKCLRRRFHSNSYRRSQKIYHIDVGEKNSGFLGTTSDFFKQ
jgi:hypothetical protein